MTMPRVILIAILAFIALVGPALIGDLVSEEIRNRLDRLPHGLIRLATRRLPMGVRRELTEEWSAELHEILRGAEALPITRLFRGTHYALGLLRTAPGIGRALTEGIEADYEQRVQLAEARVRLAEEQARIAEARARLAEEQTRAQIRQVTEQLFRLQEADRMKADLLATVTHELRIPLTTILGALKLLESRNRKLTSEQRLEFITMGLRQGDRLQRMIEQLLAARFERPPATGADSRRVELDASELVRQAGEEAQMRHHERPIMIQANGSLPVHAVQDAVSQVLANLIDNACKYSPQGQPIHLSGTRSNGHAVLAVEDSGPGVDPDDREGIFEQFTQLDGSSEDRGEGIGLGLYIARELARSQGGDLLITEPTGTEGARFELRLPLHRS